MVTNFEDLIPSLVLQDPDDRHVLAAAIRTSADLILTFNIKDFPAELLRPYGIEACHPDPDPSGSPTGTLAPGASVSHSPPSTKLLQSPVASSPGFVVLTVSMPDLIQPGGAVSIEPRPECRLTLKHQPMRLAKAALSTWFWGERLLMVSNDHGPNGKKQPYWIRWEATPVDWL